MNGTADPLSPFNGGEVKFYGLISSRGFVRSSRDSAQYFAGLNNIAGAPAAHATNLADGFTMEQMVWRGGGTEVELVAIVGGGHGIPQPYARAPRLLGPTPREPNGPELIWDFFARQPSR